MNGADLNFDNPNMALSRSLRDRQSLEKRRPLEAGGAVIRKDAYTAKATTTAIIPSIGGNGLRAKCAREQFGFQ